MKQQQIPRTFRPREQGVKKDVYAFLCLMTWKKEKRMKILVINSNTSDLMTKQIDFHAKMYANPETEITTVSAASGPRSIEGEFDVALAAIGTLERLIASEKKYDGFVVACGCDPGLYACREVTSKPVVGIGEASMYMACLLGHKFTSMTALWRMVPRMEKIVKKYGLWERCASVRAASAAVLEIAEARDKIIGAFIEQARLAIEQDGADVIALSGAAMVEMDKRMEQVLGVPVTDGVVSAVKFVESQIAYKLGPNKQNTFSFPEKKEAIHISDVLQSVYRE
jgi:allantoin racemase